MTVRGKANVISFFFLNSFFNIQGECLCKKISTDFKMNVVVTTFKSPFSFFCVAEEDGKDIDLLTNSDVLKNVSSSRYKFSDVTHGQYVAVMWKNKWARGLITLESQFLIWLIDYGLYLRPNDKTVYINLPATYKKVPTKVFEASIHGVAPVDRALNDKCEIKNKLTNIWTAGAVEKAQTLIASASRVYFAPIALMTTKNNDIMIGDLYLELNQKKIVNIIDELELWPVFLERNKTAYIESLPVYYTSRRKHRACLLTPALADSNLPLISLETSLNEYNAICDSAPKVEAVYEVSDDSEDGSTVVEYSSNKNKTDFYKLSAAEVEKYANMHVVICGRQYNVLNVLLNKIRDLNICERYKDHDLKSIGRASYRNPPKSDSP